MLRLPSWGKYEHLGKSGDQCDSDGNQRGREESGEERRFEESAPESEDGDRDAVSGRLNCEEFGDGRRSLEP